MDKCGAWDVRSWVEYVRCICVWLGAAWVGSGVFGHAAMPAMRTRWMAGAVTHKSG